MIARIVLLLKIIHPIVHAEENPVIWINTIIQFQVKIGKMQIIDPRIELLEGPCNIGSPARNKKGDMLLPDWSLQGESGGEQPHAAIHAKVLHIPVLGPDINQGGEPAPVIGRKISLVNLHILDGIGNNGTEKTQQVGGIVNRGLINGNQVLVPSPSPHIKDGGPIPEKLDARNGCQ